MTNQRAGLSSPKTFQNGRSGPSILVHRDAWQAEAVRRFGEDPKQWRFRCVCCGNVQSMASVVERNPGLDKSRVPNWIFFACEGRHTDGVGCDWTLGGLFTLHTLEVRDDDRAVPTFEFDGELWMPTAADIAERPATAVAR